MSSTFVMVETMIARVRREMMNEMMMWNMTNEFREGTDG